MAEWGRKTHNLAPELTLLPTIADWLPLMDRPSFLLHSWWGADLIPFFKLQRGTLFFREYLGPWFFFEQKTASNPWMLLELESRWLPPTASMLPFWVFLEGCLHALEGGGYPHRGTLLVRINKITAHSGMIANRNTTLFKHLFFASCQELQWASLHSNWPWCMERCFFL